MRRPIIGIVRGGKVELPEGHGLGEGEAVKIVPLGPRKERANALAAVEKFVNSPAPPEDLLKWIAESPELDIEGGS